MARFYIETTKEDFLSKVKKVYKQGFDGVIGKDISKVNFDF